MCYARICAGVLPLLHCGRVWWFLALSPLRSGLTNLVSVDSLLDCADIITDLHLEAKLDDGKQEAGDEVHVTQMELLQHLDRVNERSR